MFMLHFGYCLSISHFRNVSFLSLLCSSLSTNKHTSVILLANSTQTISTIDHLSWNLNLHLICCFPAYCCVPIKHIVFYIHSGITLLSFPAMQFAHVSLFIFGITLIFGQCHPAEQEFLFIYDYFLKIYCLRFYWIRNTSLLMKCRYICLFLKILYSVVM